MSTAEAPVGGEEAVGWEAMPCRRTPPKKHRVEVGSQASERGGPERKRKLEDREVYTADSSLLNKVEYVHCRGAWRLAAGRKRWEAMPCRRTPPISTGWRWGHTRQRGGGPEGKRKQ